MTNKRHAPASQSPQPTTPRAPALDPDTGEPLDNVAVPTPAAAPSGAAAETAADVWKDRHLRLAADFENFRKRTAKERTEMWMRAQADLVGRLADALDDLSRFAHIDPAETDAKTLHEGVDLVERKVWKELEAAGVTRIDQAGGLELLPDFPFDQIHALVQ